MSHSPPPAAGNDDMVPVSVRLGEVVPPEDPEDWTRPLTWAAAGGMLAAPLTALTWFWLWPPAEADRLLPGTLLLAAILAAGAAVTGATQQGALRALAGTLAAALFAAVVTVAVGALAAGERQAGIASPTLAHALAGTLAGLGGALAAAPAAAALSTRRAWVPRTLGGGGVAVGVAILLAPFVFGS